MAPTFLLVDDSDTIRNILKVYLMNFGAKFVEAADGREALEAVHKAHVDLVIADVNMPGMDGISFVRELRGDPKDALRTLPVILLTGNANSKLPAKPEQVGANDLIKKPVASDRLQAAVRRLLPAEA